MTSATTETLLKILDTLPKTLQERTLEHVREHIQDLREEQQWQESFDRTQDALTVTTQKARKEIAERKTTPIDMDSL